MRRLTSASIALLDPETSNAGELHAGSARTHSGLSHSCERPTSMSPAPSAQTISVPLASNDTTRTVNLALSEEVAAASRVANRRDSWQQMYVCENACLRSNYRRRLAVGSAHHHSDT